MEGRKEIRKHIKMKLCICNAHLKCFKVFDNLEIVLSQGLTDHKILLITKPASILQH